MRTSIVLTTVMVYMQIQDFTTLMYSLEVKSKTIQLLFSL